MKSKRIAVLIPKYNGIGGLEKYARILAYSLAESQQKVTLLTTDAVAENQPFQIVSFPTHAKFAYCRLRSYDKQCQEWLKDHPMDIVFGLDRHSMQTHYRTGNGVHAAYLARRAQHCSIFKRAALYLTPLHRTILNFEKAAFESRHTKRIFANSHMVKEEILRYYDADPKKISVIHNGVEWKEMQHPFNIWESAKQNILHRFNLPAERFHYVFISNDYRRKGLPFLLKSLSLLDNPSFHLSVIGKDRQIKQYIKLAEKLGLSRQVSFLGHQPSCIPFYQLADAIVIPTSYDPFANVTVEGLAMGCFVITSNQNGGAEVITSENGKVIGNLEDYASFSSILASQINHPKTAHMAESIRESVRQLDFKEQLKKITQKLLSE